jgi:exosome complex exonuclease DIS3/RRP44
MPRIRIETRQREELLDKRIVVAIDSWDVYSKYPRGHYIKTLGKIGEKDVETQVVLLEHEIPTGEFSAAVMACLPPANWEITAENSRDREDYRHLQVCSIDPPGCKDIDDALHFRRLENGNVEIGVHIADVTHFVKPGTAIDKEAANRGNTTYLVEKRLDMLPGLLTTSLCSLVPNKDRFAFSAIWEVTPAPDVTVVRTKFAKSIIHSRAALSYSQAQNIIDDPADNSDLADNLRSLNQIAKVLRYVIVLATLTYFKIIRLYSALQG